jgi:hypothetical protein
MALFVQLMNYEKKLHKSFQKANFELAIHKLQV